VGRNLLIIVKSDLTPTQFYAPLETIVSTTKLSKAWPVLKLYVPLWWLFFLSHSPAWQNQNGPNSTVNAVWYVLGKKLPDAEMCQILSEALPNVLRYVENFVPTTYEAAQAFLHEELKKPKGQRDLRREMCVFVLVAPEDPGVSFKPDSINYLIPLSTGE
jgi:hypothetical protein